MTNEGIRVQIVMSGASLFFDLEATQNTIVEGSLLEATQNPTVEGNLKNKEQVK